MHERRDPDAACFLVSDVDQDSECAKSDADHDGAKEGLSKVIAFVEIASENDERPVPDSPESAA